MQDGTYTDWCCIINFERVAAHVYMYDHSNRTAGNATCQDLAWPITWILGRFHKKHISCGKKLPNPDMITADLKQFIDKQHWQWVLKYSTTGIRLHKILDAVLSNSGGSSTERECAPATRLAPVP
jgi:hypothetical protein